jgi:hypothetical protein
MMGGLIFSHLKLQKQIEEADRRHTESLAYWKDQSLRELKDYLAWASLPDKERLFDDYSTWTGIAIPHPSVFMKAEAD